MNYFAYQSYPAREFKPMALAEALDIAACDTYRCVYTERGHGRCRMIAQWHGTAFRINDEATPEEASVVRAWKPIPGSSAYLSVAIAARGEAR